MLKNLDNCFYCQSLGGLTNFPTYGKCAFCGARTNPLYPVIYQGKQNYFCCGCAWWQYPRTEQEKAEENQWYQSLKKQNTPIAY